MSTIEPFASNTPSLTASPSAARPSRQAADNGADTKSPHSKQDEAELEVVSKLAATDRHVRAHELAHLAAAGPYAVGGPSYTYARGPDGRYYAVGGEVALDAGPDPAGPSATIRKAQVIEAAALAPSDPSPQDRIVAADAAHMEEAAQAELVALQRQQVRSAYQQPEEADAQLVALL